MKNKNIRKNEYNDHTKRSYNKAISNTHLIIKSNEYADRLTHRTIDGKMNVKRTTNSRAAYTRPHYIAVNCGFPKVFVQILILKFMF